MATTIPETFTGTPTLTDEKVNIITEWYHRMLGDSDKADDVESEAWYFGQAEGFLAVLTLLYAADIDEFLATFLGDATFPPAPERSAS